MVSVVSVVSSKVFYRLPPRELLLVFMIVVIDTLLDEPYQDLTVDLDGITFQLSFLYNQRFDRWYLSIRDAAGLPIVYGIKMVCLYNLIKTYNDERLPPGSLVVFSSIVTDQSPPGLSELGSGRRCSLYYIESGDTTFTVPA